jgi:hypothetical protein
MKPMKIMKAADKFLNDGQNMYLPKDHPSYSAIAALLYTKNVSLDGDVEVFDVIVEAEGDNVWVWLELDDGRDNGYSFTKTEVKELLSRPTAFMQILRNAMIMLAEVDQLLFNSDADWIIRGIMAEFGTPIDPTDDIVDILIDHELVHVFILDNRELDTRKKQSFQFKVEFVSDYERLVNLKGALHVLQTKFALA